MSSGMVVFLPPADEVEVEDPLDEEAGAVAMALAPEDLGLSEHMGAAHTEASGRAARRERGRSMVSRKGGRD